MLHIAKIFRNGKSQAVRLPKDFRFDCNEVYVRRDPANGDVILSRKPGSWSYPGRAFVRYCKKT